MLPVNNGPPWYVGMYVVTRNDLVKKKKKEKTIYVTPCFSSVSQQFNCISKELYIKVVICNYVIKILYN